MNKRVVITGLGAVTPIGNDIPTFRKNLREGISGEGPITCFDCSHFPVKRAFEVKNFDSRKYRVHLMDPFIQYAMAATAEAIEDARFKREGVDPFRIGLSIGTSKGGVHTIDRFKERFKKHPSAIMGARIYTNAVPNFAAQWVARRWKIKGPSLCYVAACATGAISIIEGAKMVAAGEIDYCIAGASDASIVPLMLAGYYNMKALSRTEMLPFDKRRQGFLVGEGAGIVFLETQESAKARGVKVYGEIPAFSCGHDCYDPVVFDPKDNALGRTLDRMFSGTDLDRMSIDYINLHGAGTPLGDAYETRQIKGVFGQAGYKIPMSANKSMTGHMLGASGAVEIIATLIAMEDGFVPPTIKLEKSDPECDLDYTPLKAREKKIDNAISISMGFGGHIAAIALRKV